MEMLYRFDDFALEMVEQPLAAEDLVAHAMLQESLRTPICLDESIASPLHAEMALDLKSCRHVNLKAGRVGGLTAAMTILEACQAAEVNCWGGAAAQSAIGARADLALAACANSALPGRFLSLGKRIGRGSGRAAASAPRCERWRNENRTAPRGRGWGPFPMPRCWRSSRCRRRRCRFGVRRFIAALYFHLLAAPRSAAARSRYPRLT